MNHAVKHLQKEFRKHTFDYLLFTTAGVFFLIALSIFKGERLLEFIILLAFVSFYIIWGLYHHLLEDSIHLKSVLEYVLIGFTVLFLIKVILLP